MKANKTLKLVTAALLAALTCVATMMIQVPTPATQGYIHLGDGFVILSGILLGPVYGAAAGGIGSMMADLLSGYTAFAPVTLIIKACGACLCGLLFRHLAKSSFFNKYRIGAILLSGLLEGIVVVAGYFSFEATLFGYGIAAAAEIPNNILQSLFGLVIAALLFEALSHVPAVKNLTASVHTEKF